MAEVKDFRAYAGRKKKSARRKKKKESTVQQTQEKTIVTAVHEEADTPEKRSSRKGLIITGVSVLLVIAVVLIATYISWRDRPYTEMRITASAAIAESESARFVALEDLILQYSKDGASCLRANGEAVWNMTFEMQNPQVRTCGGTVAIGDQNSRHIYVADTTGARGVIETTYPLRAFEVSGQGVVAAVLDGGDVTWISLYDAQGTELASFRTTMSRSGYPVAVSVSPNGKLVCVSYLQVEEAQMRTSIAFYNFGAVGQNQTDNFVSGHEYPDAVAPLVHFMNDRTSYAVATDRIAFFSGAEMPTLEGQELFGDEEIQAVYDGTTHVGVLFADSTGENAFRLQVYDTSGHRVLSAQLDRAYAGILFQERQVVLYDSDEWLILGMNGEERYRGAFESGVRAVIPTSSPTRFYLVMSDRVQTAELK